MKYDTLIYFQQKWGQIRQLSSPFEPQRKGSPSRVLEEKVNETQVSKTVFGRFNLNVPVDTIS